MSRAPGDAQWVPSVLVDFDAGDLLDAMSTGIIVLDAQVCTIYANTTAEDVLAVRLESLRGLPFASFLPQPKPFLDAIAQVLEGSEAVTFELPGYPLVHTGEPLNPRLKQVRPQVTGMYLLLELGGSRIAIQSSPGRAVEASQVCMSEGKR